METRLADIAADRLTPLLMDLLHDSSNPTLS
jgi:hypothetical protein